MKTQQRNLSYHLNHTSCFKNAASEPLLNSFLMYLRMMHIKINVIIIIMMQLIKSSIISRNGTFTAVRMMTETSLLSQENSVLITATTQLHPAP